jgi:hypothetical protein
MSGEICPEKLVVRKMSENYVQRKLLVTTILSVSSFVAKFFDKISLCAIYNSTTNDFRYGNRQYYWGQQYYQNRPGYQMCRMPIDPTDEQFGNVYFQDQTRPREVVWGCGKF